MTFPSVSGSAWRAQVEKELAGRPFDKALVHFTLEGLPISPLYTEAPSLPRVLGDGAPFRICMRHDASATEADILDDLDGGADALWIPEALPRNAAQALAARRSPHVLLLVDEDDRSCLAGDEPSGLVSTLALHAQGADACDEIALALAMTVERLSGDPSALVVRVAVGRDTFFELCKLRALRLGLRKVLAASGRASTALAIHAVASSRTLSARDPWVNMLRVTTETFAAVLGGADLVTPRSFDEALMSRSALGRRVARNTGHVLREESSLGRVVDPGAGSYYLDTLTDAIARDAWERFRGIERLGGIAKATASGQVAKWIGTTREARRDAISKRKLAVLGVSEFANLGEQLPSPPRSDADADLRDGAAFEALRAKADLLPEARREVLLATLGPSFESRARVGFAASVFAAGGLRAREILADERAAPGAVACICGTDERYASEASARARALREDGASHVLLAGRPGGAEAELRAAGVDGFVFLGCDVVATLQTILGGVE